MATVHDNKQSALRIVLYPLANPYKFIMEKPIKMIDNKVRTLIQDVYHQVQSRMQDDSISIAEGDVKYLVEMLLLNPKYNKTSKGLERKKYVSLGQHAVDQFLNDPYHLHLITIKMVTLWLGTQKELKNIVKKHHEHVALRVEPLILEIMEPFINVNDLPTDIYRRLVVTTVILSGLGNPANVAVYREAKAALSSVFKPSEIETFLTLNKQEKWSRIQELTQLVTGIRIFNAKRGMGGEGFPPLTDLLQQAIESTIRTLVTAFTKSDERRLLLERAIQLAERPNDSLVKGEMPPMEAPNPPLYARKEELDNEEEELKNNQDWEAYDLLMDERNRYFELSNMSKEELMLKKTVLSTTWNLHYYLKNVLDLMVNQRFQVNLFLERLNYLHVELSTVTHFRTAIPTEQIFPLFFDLAQIWKHLQDEMLLINVKVNFTRQLIALYHPLEKFSDELEKILGPASKGPNDKIRLENELMKPDSALDLILMPDVQYIPLADQDITQLNSSFNGFCPIALTLGNGLLRKGLPELGYSRWLDRLYVCSTRRALARFCREPDRYVAMALHLARSRSDLVEILQIHDDLIAVQDIECLVPDRPERLPTSHVGVQTELHPVPTRIDPSYTWNQWDLLRQCIKLTDIVERRTHSTQTQWSQFRRDVNLLMRVPPSKETQTRKDNSSNTIKPRTWIWGLRGFNTRDQHKVWLSRPQSQELCKVCKSLHCPNYPFYSRLPELILPSIKHECFLEKTLECET